MLLKADADIIEWAPCCPEKFCQTCFQKMLTIILKGPIVFIIDAAAEFGWAHNFCDSSQCIWMGPLFF
jgi:hypothetical protein